MSRLVNERGVAMVTVLLVGAAMTVLASTATYVAIDEFSATEGDRNAAQAFAYAEAGIDRLVQKIRNGDLTWREISRSGCDSDHPTVQITGTFGTGNSYTTKLEPYDARSTTPPSQRFVPDACPPPSTVPSPRVVNNFVVTSTGTKPEATRIIRQVLEIKALGLPIGIYAYERVDANGTVNMHNINLVSEGTVFNRDKMNFFGIDPYFTVFDFYGTTDPPMSADLADEKMPASVHAKGAIYYGPASRFTEHRTGFEPNCEANPGGKAAQSLWDGSGTAVLTTIGDCLDPDWTGAGQYPPGGPEGTIETEGSHKPPTSQFTESDRRRVAPEPTLSEQDYLTLKTAAKQTGLYCSGGTKLTLTCSKAGGAPFPLPAGQLDANHVDAGNSPGNPITARSFVVYIDFNNDGADPFLRNVSWTGNADIGPCTTLPATNKSAVIVVRRGSVDFSGGAEINGALFVPEGQVQSTGNFTVQGTIITRRIDVRGTATLYLSSCWLANLPGPFLDVTTAVWTEVDR